MSKEKILKQERYPDIEFINHEPDIIEIWQFGKDEGNVIHIEKENVNDFINALTAIMNG